MCLLIRGADNSRCKDLTTASGTDILSCRLARAAVYVTHALLETLAGDGWAPADTDAGGGLTGAAPSSFPGPTSVGIRVLIQARPMVDGLPKAQAISGLVLSWLYGSGSTLLLLASLSVNTSIKNDF